MDIPGCHSPSFEHDGGRRSISKPIASSSLSSSISALFLLAVLAYLMASQEVIKNYNFEYPLWGLLVGMLIGNTLGIPRW